MTGKVERYLTMKPQDVHVGDELGIHSGRKAAPTYKRVIRISADEASVDFTLCDGKHAVVPTTVRVTIRKRGRL